MTNAAASSFRDPAGRCYHIDHRIIRPVRAANAAACEAFLQTSFCQEFIARGQLVRTRKLSESEVEQFTGSASFGSLWRKSEAGAVFEHERISFPSYAHEWPPEMLWEAGWLTLELARNALKACYGLKDATPSNILFRGPTPVFIDFPSFELRDPGDPTWLAYGQFVRTFLLPLLANRYWGLRLADIFVARRDGLEPQEVYPWCGWLQRFRPPFFSLVSMPTWLRRKATADGEGLFRRRLLSNPEKARFISDSLLAHLQRSLTRLKPTGPRASQWSGYMTDNSYSEGALAAKEEFVRQWIEEYQPARVLDVGANTGHFSRLAAQAGASVVAVDLDPVCAGVIWERAVRERLDILPLVVNLSRPSPAIGWKNRECLSFLERARGHFDCVLILAAIHHLVVSERIPLNEILGHFAELTTSTLVVEFVAPEDGMFRQLARGREHLYAGLNEAAFEQACAAHFEIVRSLKLPGTPRTLYGLRRKGHAP